MQLTSLITLALVTTTLTARADDERHWYGWQILLAGGSSLAVGVVGLALDDEPATPIVTTVGAAGYLFSGPLVHWLHGRVGTGFLSLGLNLGIPLATGAIAGALVAGSGSSNHAFGGFELGFIFIGVPIGLITAVVVDGLVLGRESRPSAVSLGLGARSDGVGIEIRGSF